MKYVLWLFLLICYIKQRKRGVTQKESTKNNKTLFHKFKLTNIAARQAGSQSAWNICEVQFSLVQFSQRHVKVLFLFFFHFIWLTKNTYFMSFTFSPFFLLVSLPLPCQQSLFGFGKFCLLHVVLQLICIILICLFEFFFHFHISETEVESLCRSLSVCRNQESSNKS